MTGLLDDFSPASNGHLSVTLRPEDAQALEELRVNMSLESAGAVLTELIRRAAASGVPVDCSACGKRYLATRKPNANRRNYCPDCRASGEANADRQRAFRERHGKF